MVLYQYVKASNPYKADRNNNLQTSTNMIYDFFVLLLHQANEIVLAICHYRKIAKFRGS